MAQVTIDEAIQIAVKAHQEGRLAEAETLYRRVLAVQPTHGDALDLLGVLAGQVGRVDESIELIARAIAGHPAVFEYHINLGESYRRAGHWDRAIASFRRATELRPDQAEAHNSLGIALRAQDRLDEAMAAFERAIALRPDFAEAYNGLGNVLKEHGRIDDALACYRKALERKPDFAVAASNRLYSLHFHPGYDARMLLAEHRAWARQYAEPLMAEMRPHDNDRTPDRRLRVGFVSPDFRAHPVGRSLLPWLSHVDRRRMEIVCYSDVPRGRQGHRAAPGPGR